jgi:hypothetical protein
MYLPGDPVEVVEDITDCFELRDCLLVLDELHQWMGARDWNKRDDAAYTRWVTQLRKRNVELLYATQEVTFVDKKIRDLTTYSYYLTSWYKLGFFIVRAYFGSREVRKRAFYTGWYWFNPYIAACYDTYKLVGL